MDPGYDVATGLRKLLERAEQEAGALGHEYKGPEHLLLALVRDEDGDGIGRAVLESMGVEGPRMVETALSLLPPPKRKSLWERLFPDGSDRERPYTTLARSLLSHATQEARSLGHRSLSSGHLLLAFLKHPSPQVSDPLRALGASYPVARAAVIDRLADTGRAGSSR